MVTEIAERLNLQMSADREQQKKELRQCKQRVSEIENLYAKLYEDLTRELLTEKRFQMLSARYDSEQEELTARIKVRMQAASAIRLAELHFRLIMLCGKENNSKKQQFLIKCYLQVFYNNFSFFAIPFKKLAVIAKSANLFQYVEVKIHKENSVFLPYFKYSGNQRMKQTL